MRPKDADGMANSAAPFSLMWVNTVCPDLSVQKLMIITVYLQVNDACVYQEDLSHYSCILSASLFTTNPRKLN